MAQLQAARVRPAYEGWNTEAAPDYLGEAQAPLVENLLCRTGKLVMRGPIQGGDNLDLPSAAYRVEGMMVKGFAPIASSNRLLVGASESSTYVGRRMTVSRTTSSVIKADDIALTINTCPQGHGVEVGDFTYSRSVGGPMLRWDGTASAPFSYATTDAPNTFEDIAMFADRIVVAGGFLGATGTPNTLLYSDPGGPVAGTAADWTDNVSGLVNQIQVGGYEAIVALGVLGRELLIMKGSDLYVLSGAGSSSFALRQVSSSIGCVDPMSVVSVDDAVYFLGNEGYYRYDGTLQLVSAAISNTLTPAVDAFKRNANGINKTSASILRGGYILLTIVGIGGGTHVSLFQGLYDYRRGTWTKFSTGVTGGGTGTPVWMLTHHTRVDRTYATDGVRIVTLSELGLPELAGGGAVASLVDVVDGTTAAIPAKWHSRLIKLGSPLEAAQLHRVLLDYRMDLGAETPGWFVSLVRGDGTSLVAEYQVPGEAAGSPTYLARRRAVADAFGEVVDCQLRVEWRTATTAITEAEIYDATIEYQSARQRPAA